VVAEKDLLVRTQSDLVAPRLSLVSWALQDEALFTECAEKSAGKVNVNQDSSEPQKSDRRRVEGTKGTMVSELSEKFSRRIVASKRSCRKRTLRLETLAVASVINLTAARGTKLEADV